MIARAALVLLAAWVDQWIARLFEQFRAVFTLGTKGTA